MAWDATKPEGTDVVSLGDDAIRANNIALEDGLDNEHQFTSADSSGVHKEGSARIYSGLAANIGAADSEEGRVYFETDTNRIQLAKAAGVWSPISPRHNCVRQSWFPVADFLLDSAAWAQFGDASFHLHITTTGGDVLILCTLNAQVDTDDLQMYLNLYLGGTALTAAPNGMAMIGHIDGQSADGETHRTAHLSWLATGLAPAAHTIAAYYKLSGAGAAQAPADFNNNIVAIEI